MIEAEKELPKGTIVIASSRNKKYNEQKFKELKQNIFNSEALYDLVLTCDLQSPNVSQFDMSHFSDYRLIRENAGKLNSPLALDKTNTKTEDLMSRETPNSEKMVLGQTDNSSCDGDQTRVSASQAVSKEEETEMKDQMEGKPDISSTDGMTSEKECRFEDTNDCPGGLGVCVNTEVESHGETKPGKKPSVEEEETVDLQHIPDFYNGKKKVVKGQKSKPEHHKDDVVYTAFFGKFTQHTNKSQH